MKSKQLNKKAPNGLGTLLLAAVMGSIIGSAMGWFIVEILHVCGLV